MGERRLASEGLASFDISERRACSALCTSRTSKRRQSIRPDGLAPRQRPYELALTRPRSGHVRLLILPRRQGWLANKKQVHRMRDEAGLMLRAKRRRKHASHLRPLPSAARRPNECWAFDFVHDSTSDGRSFRVLTVIGARKRLALEVERSFSAERVTDAPERGIARRNRPAKITCDNGTECTSHRFDAWA